MCVIKTKGLKKYYGFEEIVKAVDGIAIEIDQGEFVAIIGSSGSGKSTLLHLLGGLDRPTEGSVEIGGQAIFEMDDDELTVFRRQRIGFVFQSYNLLPMINVEENILLPLRLDRQEPDEIHITEIIKTLGLENKLLSMPSHLSGGQQQRVAIARALATKPAIVLADEPTGNLDSKTGMQVAKLLIDSGKELGQTLVLVTHNMELAEMADRIIQIRDGRVA